MIIVILYVRCIFVIEVVLFIINRDIVCALYETS